MSLIDDTNALKARILTDLPDTQARGDAVAACDQVLACIRLVAIDDEKAAASTLAKVDVMTLRPVEREAWVGLARAQKAAADEAKREADDAASSLVAAEAVVR